MGCPPYLFFSQTQERLAREALQQGEAVVGLRHHLLHTEARSREGLREARQREMLPILFAMQEGCCGLQLQHLQWEGQLWRHWFVPHPRPRRMPLIGKA